MDIFLPVLFISLLITTAFLFFAFFPIRVSWFYHDKNFSKKARNYSTNYKSRSKNKKSETTRYDFSRDYKFYGASDDFDNYDDPEL